MIPKERTWRDAFLLVLKGMAMGTANKIPGVSGGIIALAAGFYEELIFSFSRLDIKAIQLLFSKGFSAFYERVNGTFLCLLFGGVTLSFFSVSLVLDQFITHYPKQVLGTFFGMIIASVYYIWNDLPKYSYREYLSNGIGIVLGIGLLWINPGVENDHWLFVFFCGMVSIAGMTLPGLSGSLLLLILGNYTLLLVDSVNALFYTFKDLFAGNGWGLEDTERSRLLGVLLFFTLGSGAGLVFFSKVLEVILRHYKSLTISTLVGFIIGSLGAVWPWTSKTTPLDENLWQITATPHNTYYFPNLVDPTTLSVVFFLFLGAINVIVLEHYGKKERT